MLIVSGSHANIGRVENICRNVQKYLVVLQPGVAAGVPGGAAAAVRERGEAGARAEVLRHPAAAVQPGAVQSRAKIKVLQSRRRPPIGPSAFTWLEVATTAFTFMP